MKTHTLSRSQAGPTLSDRGYAFSVGLFTTLGMAATGLAAFLASAITLTMPMFIALLLTSFVGIFVAKKKSTTLALIGYAMIAIPLGVMLGPVAILLKLPQIITAVALTGGLTTAMWIVATMVPKISEGVGLYVIGGLLVLLMGMFIFTSGVAYTAWTVIGIIFFCAVLIYDVNNALNDDDKTMSSAIFNSVGIYLDVLNILIRIMSLSGSSRN
jgi:FtsH-binding integral membrane protein